VPALNLEPLRAVAARAFLLRAVLAVCCALAAWWGGAAPFDGATLHGVEVASVAPAGELPSGAVLEACGDDHEEAALVEVVESSDDSAIALPWPDARANVAMSSHAPDAAGSWRRAPARRKCARGPPVRAA
jgi:hypothetical protein